MLMFGPKNAPAKQTHYLYLPVPPITSVNNRLGSSGGGGSGGSGGNSKETAQKRKGTEGKKRGASGLGLGRGRGLKMEAEKKEGMIKVGDSQGEEECKGVQKNKQVSINEGGNGGKEGGKEIGKHGEVVGKWPHRSKKSAQPSEGTILINTVKETGLVEGQEINDAIDDHNDDNDEKEDVDEAGDDEEEEDDEESSEGEGEVWRDAGGCMSGDDSVDCEETNDALSLLRRQCPRRGCVMTVTQFDGIPMADCFKVIQYWIFEREGQTSTTIRVGVAVHFIKKTMLKSQVFSGVRDELRDLSKRWCAYYERRIPPAHPPLPLSAGECSSLTCYIN